MCVLPSDHPHPQAHRENLARNKKCSEVGGAWGTQSRGGGRLGWAGGGREGCEVGGLGRGQLVWVVEGIGVLVGQQD